MIVNNEFERMWKETVLALYKILSQHLPGVAEEDHETHSLGFSVF
jgi:hypothetical protein